MIGNSIYVSNNPALVGGSPQAEHERLWAEGQRRRLQVRAGLSAAGLTAGTLAVALWFGLLAAALIACGDTIRHWRGRTASSVWRKGQRGERRTARILRTLEWRGYNVLHGRSIPGYGQIDHLVIGGTGVVMIDNQAVSPETEIAEYSGTLYVDEQPGAKMAAALRDRARETTALLRERLDRDIPVEPVAIVYGGTLRNGRLRAEGITILRARSVPGWIRRHRISYTPGQVAAIVEAANTLPISREALLVR